MEDFLDLVESEGKMLVAKQIVSFSFLFFFSFLINCSQGWPVWLLFLQSPGRAMP